jgi:hypothetical protein
MAGAGCGKTPAPFPRPAKVRPPPAFQPDTDGSTHLPFGYSSALALLDWRRVCVNGSFHPRG